MGTDPAPVMEHLTKIFEEDLGGEWPLALVALYQMKLFLDRHPFLLEGQDPDTYSDKAARLLLKYLRKQPNPFALVSDEVFNALLSTI